MKSVKIDKQLVTETAQKLKSGDTILFPTDTIWGIGCDATNADAVAKIYKIKQRELSKALVVLVAEIDDVAIYADKISEVAWDLLEYTEKPLTVVYEQGKNIAPNLKAKDGSIAIRVVQDEFCKQLIHRLGRPVVATSANISGHPSPSSYSDIDPVIIASTDYIVEYRQEETMKSPPSQIIKLDQDGTIKIIRK